MKPRIVAMSGPLKGSVFPITESAFTLGRDAESSASLEDDLVSRNHCRIQLEPEGVLLRDLESTNGTFVNGGTIATKLLEHGDRIKLGSSTFIYMDHDEDSPTEPILADFDRDRRRSIMTVRADRGETGHPNTAQLQARLVELVLKTIPARRAAILLVGRNPEEFVDATYHDRPFSVSRTIARQVLRDGLAVLSNDGDSIIAVPLTVSGTKLGIVYADNENPSAFTQDHLEQMLAVARIAGAAFGHAHYVEWLEGENERLKEQINAAYDLVGDSPAMQHVYEFIRKAGPTNSTVLILGESGTGKNLVAHALHRNSKRRNGPFVIVNCATLVESLLSEVFGYEKGAFTGAVAAHKGKIEVADGGTLFLDEIGELPMPLQAALLRVLEHGEFERVGGTRSIHVDIRIIAATNRNLEEAVKEGRFRQDLFYRLQVLPLRTPTLRERSEDIPLLAAHFIKKYRGVRRVAGITVEAKRLLSSYDWPGNVRELENAIERAVAVGTSSYIRPEDLPEAVTERKTAYRNEDRTYHALLNMAKKTILDNALKEVGWDFPEAAVALDLRLGKIKALPGLMDLSC